MITLVVGGAIGAGAIAACLALFFSQLPQARHAVAFDVEKVGALDPLNERSIVLDRYGRTIAVLRSEQNRSPVDLARVPRHVINAVLDTEDADFYVHKGVNLRSTIRAVAANVEAGGVAQGGSTITQQLVKLTLLTPKQDLNRKVTEARLALQIEKEYTKAEILGRYLNLVYLGEGAYGLEAAAERYFNTSVDKLTVVQGAFLAGMIRNPTGYDPVRFRERSRQRRSTVLDRLVARKHLTQVEADQLKKSPMPRPADRLAQPDTYFIENVKQSLLDDIRLGETANERYNAVFNGGLKISTTFDPTLQAEAERAVVETLPENEPDFTAALVSIDVTSGAVRALVGGRGFATDKYDLATQGKRQPGSSWKPFIYTAALEAGISPRSSISGLEPCQIPNPGGTPDPFEPSNAEPGSGKVATIPDQLVASSNCAFARLAYVVGYDKVASVAKRMGITTNIDLVPAMALGVEEVHPLDMAGAYATLAAEGLQRTPYFISDVKDRDGKTLFVTKPSTKRLIDVEIARTVTAAMRRVITSGTGTAARLDGYEAAGKTGTTNNYEDAWFVGFTNTLSTAVWMGAPDKKVAMRNVGGIRVYGGTYPARIWHAFMTDAMAGSIAIPFTEPDEKAYPKGDCIAINAVRGKNGKLVPSSVTSSTVTATSIDSRATKDFRTTTNPKSAADSDAGITTTTTRTTTTRTTTTRTTGPTSTTTKLARTASVALGSRGFSIGLSMQESAGTANANDSKTNTATTVKSKNKKKRGRTCTDILGGSSSKKKAPTTIAQAQDTVSDTGAADSTVGEDPQAPTVAPVPAVTPDPGPAPEPPVRVNTAAVGVPKPDRSQRLHGKALRFVQ